MTISDAQERFQLVKIERHISNHCFLTAAKMRMLSIAYIGFLSLSCNYLHTQIDHLPLTQIYHEKIVSENLHFCIGLAAGI